MKKYFVLLLLISQTVLSQNPLFIIKDKAQLMPGVALNQAPDYSLLSHYKAFPNQNMYVLKKEYAIKGTDYTLDTTYITIQNSRVLDILFIIKGETVYNSIKRDLEAIYPSKQRVVNAMNTVYVDEPVSFSLMNKYLFVRFDKVDTLTPPKDETGLTKLPGRKFSDPLIREFFSKMGNDYQLKVSEAPTQGSYWLYYTWKEKGLTLTFSQWNIKNGEKESKDTVLNNIALNPVINKKIKYYKGWEAYTGPLPYNIDAGSNYYSVIDKFGKPDNWQPYMNSSGGYTDYVKIFGVTFSFEIDVKRKTEENKISEIRIFKPYNTY